jgi:hypothetical protein
MRPDETEKKKRLREIHAILDRIAQGVTVGTFYASAVGSWALKHAPRKRDLSVLFLRWKTGDLHIHLGNPIERVRLLLAHLEVEALSTLWNPGWNYLPPTGKRYGFNSLKDEAPLGFHYENVPLEGDDRGLCVRQLVPNPETKLNFENLKNPQKAVMDTGAPVPPREPSVDFPPAPGVPLKDASWIGDSEKLEDK